MRQATRVLVLGGMKVFGCSCLSLLLLGACATDDPSSPVGETEVGTEAGTSEGSTANESSTTSETSETSTSSSGDTSSDMGHETEGETTGESTTEADTTEEPTTGGTGSDSDGGSTGLEGMCERAFECGSTYYSDVQACVDASTDYWGSCPEVLAALDAFGDCMITVPCEDYNPDAYNPANTICSEQWSQVQQSSC